MISWEGGILRLQTDFIGRNAASKATAHGQGLWELGDVAELFIQKVGEESYREYQVAPNGFTLTLCYPGLSGVAAVRSGARKLDEFITGEIPSVDIATTPEGWRVSLSIPLSASPGDRFRVSCCRYDYYPGGVPVISSTSLHPVRDFHRPQEWAELTI